MCRISEGLCLFPGRGRRAPWFPMRRLCALRRQWVAARVLQSIRRPVSSAASVGPAARPPTLPLRAASPAQPADHVTFAALRDVHEHWQRSSPSTPVPLLGELVAATAADLVHRSRYPAALALIESGLVDGCLQESDVAFLLHAAAQSNSTQFIRSLVALLREGADEKPALALVVAERLCLLAELCRQLGVERSVAYEPLVAALSLVRDPPPAPDAPQSSAALPPPHAPTALLRRVFAVVAPDLGAFAAAAAASPGRGAPSSSSSAHHAAVAAVLELMAGGGGAGRQRRRSSSARRGGDEGGGAAPPPPSSLDPLCTDVLIEACAAASAAASPPAAAAAGAAAAPLDAAAFGVAAFDRALAHPGSARPPSARAAAALACALIDAKHAERAQSRWLAWLLEAKRPGGASGGAALSAPDLHWIGVAAQALARDAAARQDPQAAEALALALVRWAEARAAAGGEGGAWALLGRPSLVSALCLAMHASGSQADALAVTFTLHPASAARAAARAALVMPAGDVVLLGGTRLVDVQVG